MKLRLMGASSEMQEVVELLQTVFDVHNVSEEYPNRGISKDVRVYVDLAVKQVASTNEVTQKKSILLVKDIADKLNGYLVIENEVGEVISSGTIENEDVLNLAVKEIEIVDHVHLLVRVYD